MNGEPRGAAGRLGFWLEERLGLSVLARFGREKTVPVHRHTIWYYFGGMTLFLFGIQVATGILLLLYYRPSDKEAFESVQFLMTSVPFGWLIRSIHSWSANLLVFVMFAHMFSVFFMKAYRKPRELTWLSGMALLGLMLFFGFSGYLLPWNALAFFATQVGTEVAGALPLVGDFALRLLRGGDQVTGGTLTRFYGFHVAILPALTTVVLGLHLFLVQKQGMHVPPAIEEERKRTGEPPPAPAGIRPERYFCWMFQLLKILPGHVLGIEGELLGILGIGAGALLFLLVPFLDPEGGSPWRGLLFTILGWVALLVMTVLTVMVYMPAGGS
jgi:cytochrome b6